MLPVVAIVGRPNVGKSTLFNRLTHTRDALITEYPGTTRDRQFGEVRLENRHFIIIDTGGITDDTDAIGQLITQQAMQAIEDADKVLFIVDGRAGITPEDKMIAKTLRRSGKPIILAVNKTEGLDPIASTTDAFELGFKSPVAIAAVHGTGTSQLIEALFSELIETGLAQDAKLYGIKLAIVGRPNVGKSTLD